MTVPDGLLDAVLDALRDHVGEDAAINRRTLSARLGVPDRKVRAAIHELVTVHGKAVGSSASGGYYLLTDRAEAGRMAAYYRSYAKRLLERARAIERAFGIETEQTRLFSAAGR